MAFKTPMLAVWTVLLVAGIASMLRYDLTPAEVEQPPRRWPGASALSLSAARPTLLLFVHPRCPCSRASLQELGDLARRFPGRMHLRVLFVKPVGFELDWEKTDLWGLAAAIPGAKLRPDENGREAARFRATASGEALLYDTSGRLQFFGGLTPFRGHRGDNTGIATLASFLGGSSVKRRQSPVFGCPLCDRSTLCDRSAEQKFIENED